METDSLSYKTLKNSSYTLINYLFPILFSVFIIPVIFTRLGVTDYGIYLLVNTIIGFLGLLDLGLGSALIKYISQYSARQDFESLQILIKTANSLFLIIGIVGFLAFTVIGQFFLSAFHISAQSQQHITLVFFLAGILNFISALSMLYSVVPAALMRFDISTKVSLIQLTVFNLAALAAVLLGYKLKVILGLNILVSLGQLWYLYWRAKKLLPNISFSFGWNTGAVKTSYKFGLVAAVSNIANSFLTQLDRLVIPIFLNPAMLSYYSLPGNVAQKTSGVIGSVTGVLFPLASTISSQGEYEQLKSIYIRFFRNVTVFAAACTVAIMSFSYQILKLWINTDVAERGNTILIILAATYFLLSLLGPLTNILMGLNKVRFLALMSIVLAVVNLVLLFGLLPKFGILGAAWAYFGAAALVPFVFWWAEKKYLQIAGQAKFYATLYAKVIFTSVIFYTVMHYLVAPRILSKTLLIIVGPLTIVVYILMYKLFGFFYAEDWQLFMDFFQKIRLRLKF